MTGVNNNFSMYQKIMVNSPNFWI